MKDDASQPNPAIDSAAIDNPGRNGFTELMSSRLIRTRFNSVIFSESHGACGPYLGVGYLYYAFAATIRSQVSVCIGSGGGFVPDLLAQAQRDLDLDPAATYLIDANLPDLGFGSPVQLGGRLRPENDFLVRASDIIVLRMLSADAARLLSYDSPAKADIRIGRWDVCVEAGRQILLTVPLMGTGGRVRPDQAEFSLTDEQSRHPVEVRTFFNGAAAICFRDLVIEPAA